MCGRQTRPEAIEQLTLVSRRQETAAVHPRPPDVRPVRGPVQACQRAALPAPAKLSLPLRARPGRARTQSAPSRRPSALCRRCAWNDGQRAALCPQRAIGRAQHPTAMHLHYQQQRAWWTASLTCWITPWECAQGAHAAHQTKFASSRSPPSSPNRRWPLTRCGPGGLGASLHPSASAALATLVQALVLPRHLHSPSLGCHSANLNCCTAPAPVCSDASHRPPLSQHAMRLSGTVTGNWLMTTRTRCSSRLANPQQQSLPGIKFRTYAIE